MRAEPWKTHALQHYGAFCDPKGHQTLRRLDLAQHGVISDRMPQTRTSPHITRWDRSEGDAPGALLPCFGRHNPNSDDIKYHDKRMRSRAKLLAHKVEASRVIAGMAKGCDLSHHVSKLQEGEA